MLLRRHGLVAAMPSVMSLKKEASCRRPQLGQADKLPGVAWSLWTHHIQAMGPSWLYPVACLGHLLCLRVTHVLSLRGKDFDLEHGAVRLQLFTWHATLEKLMSEAAFDFVHKLQVKCISAKRLKTSGSGGRRFRFSAWNWPEGPEEYLFPPRAGTADPQGEVKTRSRRQSGGPGRPSRSRAFTFLKYNDNPPASGATPGAAVASTT